MINISIILSHHIMSFVINWKSTMIYVMTPSTLAPFLIFRYEPLNNCLSILFILAKENLANTWRWTSCFYALYVLLYFLLICQLKLVFYLCKYRLDCILTAYHTKQALICMFPKYKAICIKYIYNCIKCIKIQLYKI